MNFDLEKVISVIDFGAAADGIVDDTEAFKAATKKAEETGHAVYIPFGTYRLTDTITLNSITVFGHISGSWCADDDKLPKIKVDHGKGPSFILNCASIAGLFISYSEIMKRNDYEEMPPAIVTRLSGGHISNLKICDAWEGIVCDEDIFNRIGNPGRFNVENIFMRDIHNTGMYLGATLDVNCIRNVEVWSPGSKRFEQQGIGFHFMKNDGIHISDCFAFNAAIGFLFDETHGKPDFNGGSLAWLSNCNVDYSGFGIVVRGKTKDENETCHYYPTQISITGGSYWCHSSGLKLESGDCRVTASSAEFRSNGAPAVDALTGESLMLNACFITRVFPYVDCPAMHVNGCDNVVVSGCIVQSKNEGIVLNENAKTFVASGCIIEAKGEHIVEQDTSATKLITGCVYK